MERQCYSCGKWFLQLTRWEICPACLEEMGIVDEELKKD